LALGDYPTDQIPTDDRRALVPALLAWYRDDPDPGVHGVVGGGSIPGNKTGVSQREFELS
jgi:hypothetical protein